MVASTNHLDQLDPGLSSRPSRFDRKYLFPLPSTEERVLYCEYWRSKLASKPSIKFPKKLCPAIAGITQDFSFAYLKEAFVATLLTIAGNRSEDGVRGGGDDEGGDLDDYELWREMKKQVKQLRDDMDSRSITSILSHSHGEESWRDFTGAQHGGNVSMPAKSSSSSQARLPHSGRVPGSLIARKEPNPRIFKRRYDCDAHDAPLLTDGGMLMDSVFDVTGQEVL